jgi:oxygen-independent coproporphyrinogen-3 oxidase
MVEGLYIHVPFCANKCPYCDFVSFVSEPSKEYLELLKRELELYKDLPFYKRAVLQGEKPIEMKESLEGEELLKGSG